LSTISTKCTAAMRSHSHALQPAVSQVAAASPSRLVVPQPIGSTLFSFFIEVELKLLPTFVLFATPLSPPPQLLKKGGHPFSSTGFSSNPIARENACHLDCSAKSCLRPSAVRR